jgi:hypothetical protein
MQAARSSWRQPPLDQPLGLYRRGRVRDFGPGGARASARRCSAPTSGSSRSASARAIRCGSRRACRSTATTSTGRRRRSMADLTFAIKSAAAPRAASPARCGSSPSSRMARRRSASASTSTAASRCARARWSSTAKAMRSARSPAAASRRSLAAADRHGLCRDASAEPGTALKLEQRGKLFEAKVVADAVRPPPLSPQGSRR